VEFFCRPV